MYATCLFCHSDLGRNESIERFPVGRRLAFDEARGRLWVVCRKCERWNLSPLEERWEAIEEAERAFRSTKMRVSTDQIGLAKLSEGLELVRIGQPQRPEMAAWRYGDQFGRRRRKQIGLAVGGVAVVGAALIAGPMLGIAGGSVFQAIWQSANAGRGIYKARKGIHVPIPGDEWRALRLTELPKVQLLHTGTDIELTMKVRRQGAGWMNASRKSFEPLSLTGDAAIKAAAAILPHVNQGGGSSRQIADAVDQLEVNSDPLRLFTRAAKQIEMNRRNELFSVRGRHPLTSLDAATRLALEMATHEESERRALEGELHILEEAWREAEEIAAIADDLLLPESVPAELERLKRGASEP